MKFDSSHPDVVPTLLAAGFVGAARAAYATIDPSASRRLDAAVDGDHGRLRDLTDFPDACQLLLAVWARGHSPAELLGLMSEMDRLSAPIWPPSETVVLALSSWSPPPPRPQLDRSELRRVLLWARVVADSRCRARRRREAIDVVLSYSEASPAAAAASVSALSKVLVELCDSDGALLSWVPQRLASHEAESVVADNAADGAAGAAVALDSSPAAVSSGPHRVSFAAPTLAAFLRDAPSPAVPVDLFAELRLNLLRAKVLSKPMWELLSDPSAQYGKEVSETRFAAAAGVAADVRDGRLEVCAELAQLTAADAAASPLAAAMWAAVSAPAPDECRSLLSGVVGPFPFAVCLLIGLPAGSALDFWEFGGEGSLMAPDLGLRDVTLSDPVLDLLEADTAAAVLAASALSHRPLAAIAVRPELLEPYARLAWAHGGTDDPPALRRAALMSRSVVAASHCDSELLRKVRIAAAGSLTVAALSGGTVDLGVFLVAAAEQLGSDRAAWQTLLGLVDTVAPAMTVSDLLDVAQLITTDSPTDTI